LDYQEEKALLEFKNNRLKIHDLTLPVQGSISNLAATPKVNLRLNSDRVDAKPFSRSFQYSALLQLTRNLRSHGIEHDRCRPSNALVTEIRGVFNDVYVKGKRALKGNLTGK
jgi:hypothetical protein